MASPSMIAVDNYLAQTFSKYSFDSTYSYVTWHKISGEALSDLRSLQMNLLQKVESSVQYYYEEEQLAKSRTLVFLVLSIILLFSLVFFILALINRSLKQIQKAALKIAGGATDIKLHHNSNDAIGSLATSIRKIDDQNRRLTLAAGNIGRGDFNTPLHLRSNEDLLSNAILQMRDNLKTFTNDLQMSREEFRKLADFMPQIVWTAMPDGTTDYLNAKWYEITGDRTENITNGWMHVLHPDDLGKSLNLWLKAVEQEKDYEIEYRFLDVRSNTYRWFLGRSVPVRDAEGNVVKWFGTCTDIHDQKMQEEILENTIATRTRELQRSNEDLQQFAHVASHDLKEPLRKIRTFGDMLQMEFGNLLPERARVYISKIQFSSERMSNMIEGVLKYSVMNASEKDLEIIQPALVLDGIKNDLELLMIQKDAKIIYGRLPKLKVIPALIYQLFYNLLNNALKFSKPDVPVEINITAKEVVSTAAHAWLDLPEGKAFICLEFADNGIGFNPDYAQKMFNVFTRLNPMHQYEGTGLGLALCKKIVQRHGGAIYAEGNEGAGASFFVLLPKE
jgi:PAS domain S-box-containing protein